MGSAVIESRDKLDGSIGPKASAVVSASVWNRGSAKSRAAELLVRGQRFAGFVDPSKGGRFLEFRRRAPS